MELINLDMLKNPLNWLTVVLMLVIFLLFIDVLSKLWFTTASDVKSVKPTATL